MTHIECMGEYSRIYNKMLPYREFVAELDKLLKRWLEHHDAPPWWWD